MKKCTMCGEARPLEEYHKDRRRKDGRTSSCRVCRTAHVVQYHKEVESWKLPASREYNRRRMTTPTARTKAVHASTRYFNANKPKTVPYNRANAAHRRIMKRYPLAVCGTLHAVLPIYEQAYMLELETGIHHQVDHIKPLQAGGIHHTDNLEILTESQHREKTIREYKVIEQLMKEHYK